MANPPVVIGPFDNVPAPGSSIKSDWAQEITQYAVDHVNDSNDAHDASAISFVPVGTVGASNVQAAIAEVALEAGVIGDHLNDAVDAHDASAISFAPTGSIAATNVQAALAEVAAEAAAGNGVTDHGLLTGLADDDHPQYAKAAALNDHLTDTSDAHDAGAISFVPTGNIASTNVQDALAEVAAEAAGAGGGGVTDHGALLGLLDNDHPQYALSGHTHLASAVLDLTEAAQDAVGAMVDSSLNYVDGTPLLQVAANGVTNIKLAPMAQNRIKGVVTTGPANPQDLTPAQVRTVISSDSGGGVTQFLRADGNWAVPAGGTGGGTGVLDDEVTNAKLANMAQNLIKGRVNSGTGDPQDLTAPQVRSVIASDSGDTTKFLNGAGQFTTPAPANMPTATLKGRAASDATGTPRDLTASEACQLLGTASLDPALFLRADGFWAMPPGDGGGGGTPGGTTRKVQFNNDGVFAGASHVEIVGGDLVLTAVPPDQMTSDDGKLFALQVGVDVLLFQGLSNVRPTLIPPGGWKHMAWNPTYAGNIQSYGSMGPQFTGSTVEGAGAISADNRHQSSRRFETHADAGADAVVAIEGSDYEAATGDGQVGGGWLASMRWGPAEGLANISNRAFCGFSDYSAETNMNPSDMTQIVGMGWDSNDAHVSLFCNNQMGNNKIDTGLVKPGADRTAMYELLLYQPFRHVGINWLIFDLTKEPGQGGRVATGSVTGPNTLQLLTPSIMTSVGASTSHPTGISFFGLDVWTYL